MRDAVFSGPALPNSSAALDDVELDLVENLLMRGVVATTWGSEIDVDIETMSIAWLLEGLLDVEIVTVSVVEVFAISSPVEFSHCTDK